MNSLYQSFVRQADESAERVCFEQIQTGELVTRRERVVATHAFERALEPLSAGSRVAVYTFNHWSFFALLAAAARRKVVLVPLDPQLHPAELSRVSDACHPSLVIAEEGRAAEFPGRIPRLGIRDILDGRVGAGPGPVREASLPGASSETLLLVYTSGSTGRSKFVRLSERNLVANATAFERALGILPGDRILSILPLYHLNAVVISGCIPVLAGATIVSSELRHEDQYFARVRNSGITICSLTPSLMRMLLEVNPDGVPGGLPRVRFTLCGTAPLPADLWQAYESRFGHPVYQGYGLTETAGWATATLPGRAARRYDTVGSPVGCEIRIATHGPARSGDKAGGIGEVRIRAPFVMQGYYRPKTVHERKIIDEDGFLGTGDLGYLDADGELHIVGRIKEVIIRNGMNIQPREIDEVLELHPAIVGASSVGIPDRMADECIVTFCVGRRGHERPGAAELKRFFCENATRFRCPDEFIWIEELPRTATGKVAAGKLRAFASGERVREIMAKLASRRQNRAPPRMADEIERRLTETYRVGGEVGFIAYWGCGGEARPKAIEQVALERLRDFVSLASDTPHVRSRLTLILADLHASLNGVPTSTQEAYFGSIREMAEAMGFGWVSLSELWREAGFSFEGHLDGELAQGAIEVLERNGISERDLAASIEKSAARHCGRFLPPRAAALHASMLLVDAGLLAERFRRSIFLTYNGPDRAPLFPRLPTFYLYPARRGDTAKPWFR